MNFQVRQIVHESLFLASSIVGAKFPIFSALASREGKRYSGIVMCGRFSQTKNPKALKKDVEFEAEETSFAPRYNIAPTQEAPVLARLETGVALVRMRWGLIPFWAEDEAMGAKMINARAETLLQKASFKSAFERRRCLVPATGYFEWKKLGRSKQPYYFTLRDSSVFCFAGLWDSWSREGRRWNTFTVITTVPNPLTQAVHDRMPVLLKPEDYQAWLDPGFKPEYLSSLLKPYPDEPMTCFPVSPLVNSPLNDTPECIMPQEPEPSGERMLF